MSSYRPYFESQRERLPDRPFGRRRYGRRADDEAFEPGGFRDLRGRDPYPAREWRERELEPEFSSHYEGDFGRGRFEEFEEWERPRELRPQHGVRRPFLASRYAETGRYAGRGPRNYQRSDERLKEEVCDRLTVDPDIDASDLEVSVENAEVTLSGSVEERRMKRDAEDCVEAIPGVRQVHNRIRVQAREEHRDEREEHQDTSAVSRFWRGAH